jgi:hypothetical protein
VTSSSQGHSSTSRKSLGKRLIDLTNWFWKTYAPELTPVITEIFNASLKLGIVPDVWKRANIVPKMENFQTQQTRSSITPP